MTKQETIAELVKLGVKHDPNAKAKDLAELLKANSPKEQTNATSKDSVLIFLKSRAYIDPKTRIESGIYVVSEIPERLSKLPESVCEVYEEDDVPVEVFHKIAKFVGIDASKLKTNDLIEKIYAVAVQTEFAKVR